MCAYPPDELRDKKEKKKRKEEKVEKKKSRHVRNKCFTFSRDTSCSPAFSRFSAAIGNRKIRWRKRELDRRKRVRNGAGIPENWLAANKQESSILPACSLFYERRARRSKFLWKKASRPDRIIRDKNDPKWHEGTLHSHVWTNTGSRRVLFQKILITTGKENKSYSSLL